MRHLAFVGLLILTAACGGTPAAMSGALDSSAAPGASDTSTPDAAPIVSTLPDAASDAGVNAQPDAGPGQPDALMMMPDAGVNAQPDAAPPTPARRPCGAKYRRVRA